MGQKSMSERTIIVGYDPEHGGEDVLSLARVLAEVLAAKPVVVSAIPWPTYLMGVEDLQRQVDAELLEPFNAVQERLRDLEVETRAIASPSPAHTLAELAEEERAAVIVLGSAHRGAVGRTLIGSVGESLMHGAPCAVAVAPRGYGERTDERLVRIAVAFDGSPEGWSALETAVGIAERCHGELTVIAVADSPMYGYANAWASLEGKDINEYERADKKRLLELAAGRRPPGLAFETRMLVGDAGTVLSEVSSEYDLIVAGSRGHGPLRRALLGSATRRLMRSSEAPVLVLARGIGIDPLGVRVDAPEAGTRERPGSGGD